MLLMLNHAPSYLQLAPRMDREQYGQDWQNLHGRVPRVSTDFNPKAAPWPGSQATRRCLIMNPDRISGRRCQCRPTRVAFLLAEGDHPLRVVACAARCSAVRAVPRTAGMKLSRCAGETDCPSPGLGNASLRIKNQAREFSSLSYYCTKLRINGNTYGKKFFACCCASTPLLYYLTKLR